MQGDSIVRSPSVVKDHDDSSITGMTTSTQSPQRSKSASKSSTRIRNSNLYQVTFPPGSMALELEPVITSSAKQIGCRVKEFYFREDHTGINLSYLTNTVGVGDVISKIDGESVLSTSFLDIMNKLRSITTKSRVITFKNISNPAVSQSNSSSSPKRSTVVSPTKSPMNITKRTNLSLLPPSSTISANIENQNQFIVNAHMNTFNSPSSSLTPYRSSLSLSTSATLQKQKAKTESSLNNILTSPELSRRIYGVTNPDGSITPVLRKSSSSSFSPRREEVRQINPNNEKNHRGSDFKPAGNFEIPSVSDFSISRPVETKTSLAETENNSEDQVDVLLNAITKAGMKPFHDVGKMISDTAERIPFANFLSSTERTLQRLEVSQKDLLAELTKASYSLQISKDRELSQSKQIDDLVKQLEFSHKARGDLGVQVDELNKTLTNEKLQNKEMLTAHIDQFESEIDHLNNHYCSKVNELVETNRTLSDEVERITHEKIDEQRMWQTEIDRLTAEQTAKLKETTEAHDHLKLEFKEMERKRENASAEAEVLREVIAADRIHAEEIAKRFRENSISQQEWHTQRILAKEEEIASVRNEFTALANQHSDLQETMSNKEYIISQQQLQIEESYEDIERLKKSFLQVDTELVKSRSFTSELTNQITLLDHQMLLAQQKYDELASSYDQLTSLNRFTSENLLVAEQSLVQERDKSTALSMQLASSEIKNNSDFEALQNQLVVSNARSDRFFQEYQDIQLQMAEVKEQFMAIGLKESQFIDQNKNLEDSLFLANDRMSHLQTLCNSKDLIIQDLESKLVAGEEVISRKQDHIVSMGNNYHKCQSKYLIAVGVLRSELNLVRRATSEAISNMQCLLQEFSDKSVNYALNHLKSGMLQQEQKHLQEQQALVLALQVAIPSTVDVSTDTLELSLDAEEDFKLSIARLSEERNDLALMVENLRESKQKSDHLASHQAACCDQLQTNALILSNQCKILEESHLLEIAKMSGAFEHQLAISNNLKLSCNALETEKTQMVGQMDSLTRLVDKLRETIQLSQEKESYLVENSCHDHLKIESLEAQLQESQSNLEAAASSAEGFQSVHRYALEEKEKLECSLSTAVSEIATLSQQLAEIRQVYEKLKKDQDDLENSVSASNKHRELLQATLVMTQQAHETEKYNNTVLQSTLRESAVTYSTEKQELEELLNKRNAELYAVQSNLNFVSVQYEDLTKSFEALKSSSAMALEVQKFQLETQQKDCEPSQEDNLKLNPDSDSVVLLESALEAKQKNFVALQELLENEKSRHENEQGRILLNQRALDNINTMLRSELSELTSRNMELESSLQESALRGSIQVSSAVSIVTEEKNLLQSQLDEVRQRLSQAEDRLMVIPTLQEEKVQAIALKAIAEQDAATSHRNMLFIVSSLESEKSNVQRELASIQQQLKSAEDQLSEISFLREEVRRTEELKNSAEELIMQQFQRMSQLENESVEILQSKLQIEVNFEELSKSVASLKANTYLLESELSLSKSAAATATENLRVSTEYNEGVITKLEIQLKESLRESIDFQYKIVQLHEEMASVKTALSAKETELSELHKLREHNAKLMEQDAIMSLKLEETKNALQEMVCKEKSLSLSLTSMLGTMGLQEAALEQASVREQEYQAYKSKTLATLDYQRAAQEEACRIQKISDERIIVLVAEQESLRKQLQEKSNDYEVIRQTVDDLLAVNLSPLDKSNKNSSSINSISEPGPMVEQIQDVCSKEVVTVESNDAFLDWHDELMAHTLDLHENLTFSLIELGRGGKDTAVSSENGLMIPGHSVLSLLNSLSTILYRLHGHIVQAPWLSTLLKKPNSILPLPPPHEIANLAASKDNDIFQLQAIKRNLGNNEELMSTASSYSKSIMDELDLNLDLASSTASLREAIHRSCELAKMELGNSFTRHSSMLDHYLQLQEQSQQQHKQNSSSISSYLSHAEIHENDDEVRISLSHLENSAQPWTFRNKSHRDDFFDDDIVITLPTNSHTSNHSYPSHFDTSTNTDEQLKHLRSLNCSDSDIFNISSDEDSP